MMESTVVPIGMRTTGDRQHAAGVRHFVDRRGIRNIRYRACPPTQTSSRLQTSLRQSLIMQLYKLLVPQSSSQQSSCNSELKVLH